MTEKSKPEQLDKIDVARWEGDKIHVLGKIYNLNFPFGSQKYHIIHNAKTGEIIEEDSVMFDDGIDIELSAIFSLVGIGIPFLIYNLVSKKLRERRKKSKEYMKNVEKFGKRNIADLKETIKDIQVYQGTIKEVSEDLGRKLERIDTGKHEKFIRAENDFWLGVKAYCLGADAIVHYQPGSSLGTPVRFKDDEKILEVKLEEENNI